MKKFLFSITLVIWGFVVCGQTFTNIASPQGIQAYSNGGTYGNGVSFFDYDGDGWDDLTFCANSSNILRYKNVEGDFQVDTGFENNADAKQVTYVDIDNDGDYDVLITLNFSPLRLYVNNQGVYEDISISSGITQVFDGYTFGAAWGDYDKDGFLDVYVCNYNLADGITNWLFHNNGDLTFTEVATELGVDNGSVPSFQAVWLDVNHDTWPDLYVVNDKSPPNALFLNQGDGTFTDISVSSGSNIVLDGMTNTVGDFNHDGLLDIYVTDDGPANQLLQANANNTYSNVAPELGVDNGQLCWSAQWIDWNLDTNKDLYFVTTTPIMNNQNYFFKQENTGVFTSYSQAFLFQDEVGAFTTAKADFDQNGYEDLALGCQTQNARLYHNSGGSNSYIKIGLEGVVSNRDGIGSWITCYFNEQTEVEYTICGEALIGQNSHHDVFGLGNAEYLDSLIVEWPSGHIDRWADLPVNQTLDLLEGETIQISFQPDTLYLCTGDSLMFTLNQFNSYVWSEGTINDTIFISEPGSYWVHATNSLGLTTQSDTLYILPAPEAEIELTIQPPLCYGDSTGYLSMDVDVAVPAEELWFHEQNEIDPINLSSGIYTYMLTDSHGCVYNDTITLYQPDSLYSTFEISSNPCFGDSLGTIELLTWGGTPPLVTTYEVDSTNLPAGDYIAWTTDSNGCTDTVLFEITQPSQLDVNIEVFNADPEGTGSIFIAPEGASPPYSIEWENGNTDFEVNWEIGIYSFTVTDSNGCQLDSTAQIFTGIEHAESFTFNLFPNPVEDELFLETSAILSVSYAVFDLRGRQIQTGKFQTGTDLQAIETSNLQQGMYFLYFYMQGRPMRAPFLVR